MFLYKIVMINVRLRNHYLFEKLSFLRKKFIKRHFYFNKEDWQFQSLYFCNLFLPISIFSDKKNGISFFAFSFLWLVPFKTSLQIHRLPSHSLKRLKIYRKKSFVNIYRTEHYCNFKLQRPGFSIDAQHHFWSENQNY